MNSQSPPAVDDITPFQRMVASCCGAIITYLFVTPLDVVRIRLQSQKNPFRRGLENGNSNAWHKAPGHFSGTLDAFIKIVRHEGIKALWSGLPPTLLLQVPSTVIYFTCYDQLCAALRVRMGDSAQEAPLLAAAIARVGSVTAITPLELVRTKMQSKKMSYREMIDCIRVAAQAEGWRSLWRGWGPMIYRDVPFSAMYWYNYERGKSWLCERYNTREPTFTITFTSGATSGIIASLATLPFDVVKTRRQVELGELQAKNLSCQFSTSTFSVMNRIVVQDGFGGLFKGCFPRLIKVAPGCAIMISTYEFGKAFFRKHNQERILGPLQTNNI